MVKLVNQPIKNGGLVCRVCVRNKVFVTVPPAFLRAQGCRFVRTSLETFVATDYVCWQLDSLHLESPSATPQQHRETYLLKQKVLKTTDHLVL